MGHEDVVVLDGGLPKWIAEGRPTTDRASPPGERHFTARFSNDLVRDARQVSQALGSAREQVIDARPAARFTGAAPEPRAGLKSGHMPGALNVPMSSLIAPDGTMKPKAALAEVFASAGVDIAKPTTASCGSGITACVLALGLARLGRWRTAVYDGSWTEWGGLPDAAVVTD
jgi:thiosulfate/3-mercaptopyruvate sulfurtransferase